MNMYFNLRLSLSLPIPVPYNRGWILFGVFLFSSCHLREIFLATVTIGLLIRELNIWISVSFRTRLWNETTVKIHCAIVALLSSCSVSCSL